MEHGHHPFGELFAQLGLPNSANAIREFCAEHSLHDEVRLYEADFWTAAQSQFLRDAWRQDADWAPIIDQLNVALHR